MNTKTAKANCKEKTSLLVAYQEASQAYSNAVFRASQESRGYLQGKYSKLHDATELARYRSLEAKDQLERNIEEHGC